MPYQFVPVDKGIEGQVRYLLDGQYCMNSFWFKAVTNPTVGDLNNTLVLLDLWWQTARLQLSSSLRVVEMRAYDRTAQVAPSQTVSTIGLPQGDILGDHAPNNVAVCCSLRTGFGHKSARGRLYVPGCPDGKVIGNTLVQDIVDQLQGAGQQILANQDNVSLLWCVASRYHDHLPRPLGVMTPINDVYVNYTVDSQRRRLPGRGR